MPDIIQKIEYTSRNSPHIANAIGGYQGFTSVWNEHDLEKDTLPFSITILGGKRSIEYQGEAKKIKAKHWQIIRLDTLYQN